MLGGLTEACADRAESVYRVICDHVVRVSTPEAAELTKLLENIFRSVNIALVNELAMLTDRMGIDIWEVVEAASTKPYGFMRFDPGPGMGGHCMPVDPFYLSWRAREFDMTTEFIELAGKINQQMPYHCVERIERALNEAAKPVKGSRILLLDSGEDFEQRGFPRSVGPDERGALAFVKTDRNPPEELASAEVEPVLARRAAVPGFELAPLVVEVAVGLADPVDDLAFDPSGHASQHVDKAV